MAGWRSGPAFRETGKHRMEIRRAGFAALTVFLVAVSAFCITGTVRSQSRLEEREIEAYYREQEIEMVREIRAYLNQAGFRDSGVSLTRVVEEDGSHRYTLTVHHDRIDGMDGEARESLKEELSAFDFRAENCSFCHEFLIAD